MRKIFLLIFIAAFSSASAQEDEMFDIKKRIEKKKIEWKKGFEQKNPIFQQEKNCRGITYFPIPTTFQLLNGKKIILNSQYKMPLNVIDKRQFQPIKNAGEYYLTNKFYIPGQPKFNDISNGAYELPLPSTLLELLKNKSK